MFSKKCIVCGNEFIKKQNESLKDWEYRHKFCSRYCADISKKGKNFSVETQFKKGHTSWLKGTKGIAQPNIGSFKKGQVGWNKGKKLSPERYEQLKKVGFFKPKFGEKSANWKGGITKISASIRTTKEYKDWRKRVFERDNFTCQECNKVGRRIHAHHIFPFYKIIERYKIKNIEDALKCKILWDISNGKTLCISCHKQTDSYLVNQFKN